MLKTILLLTASALTIAAGVLAVSWSVKKRFQIRTDLFGFGALCFVAAQAVHIPVLIGLTAIFKHWPISDASLKLAVNVLILGGTAGLFEELSRYLFLRSPKLGATRWADALGFGLGHGGVEALLLTLGMPIQAGYLLWKGDELIAQVKAKSPESADAVVKQVESLRHMDLNLALLPIWERALAILLHVALTLVVWKAVRTGRRGWLALAILWHAAIDGAVVWAAQKGLGPVQIELAFTAASTLSAAVVWRSWRANRESARPALA
ncbi:MAG: YhfC family intramembrane metalloprotease [Deltaproteobacteria bacterium]|nr:YhfC family intramembrane metalloprotease [Deltaproteobacteria bacterium]